MKRFACVLTALMLCALSASAALDVTWTQGEEWFPDRDAWIYYYAYTVPEIGGSDALSEELNHYFDTAIGEMVNLVIPMFTADMPGDGRNEITDRYEITCNNDEFFSFLLRRGTLSEGNEVLSLQSAVFAVSGQYTGESLTLRGLAREIGESSSQIAGFVIKDIWRKIEERIKAGDWAVRKDMSFDLLSAEFFPETHFFADEQGNIAFYLQPGLLGPGEEMAVFTYTPEELENLLEP